MVLCAYALLQQWRQSTVPPNDLAWCGPPNAALEHDFLQVTV